RTLLPSAQRSRVSRARRRDRSRSRSPVGRLRSALAPTPRRRRRAHRGARACRSHGVELLEERLRLAQLLPGRQLRRPPTPPPARVVAGEDRVRETVLLGHVLELERSGEHVVVSEQLVKLLAREGQERREQDLE